MNRKQLPKARIARRFSLNIFGQPKFDKILRKKNYKPGMHGEKKKGMRSKISDHGRQLLEKQKVRFSYGLSERQFRNTFEKAKKQKGQTGSNFLALLEKRLDTVVFRSGLAQSQSHARQLVSHGHVLVNNARVNIPSYTLRINDRVIIDEKSTSISKILKEWVEKGTYAKAPAWIDFQADRLEASIMREPAREDITLPIQEELITELYARK